MYSRSKNPTSMKKQLSIMKKQLSILVILGIVTVASAQYTNIYTEDFGGGYIISSPMSGFGWTNASPNPSEALVYFYNGIDQFYTWETTAVTNAYFTTDASGPGPSGDVTFSDINPAAYTSLTLSMAVEIGYLSQYETVRFAVQVGGQWYASVTPLAQPLGNTSYNTDSLIYNPVATNWYNLTITANGATIGSQASGNLSGPITGVGLVANWQAAASWNFTDFQVSGISTNAPPVAPTIVWVPQSQTVYAGAGVSFAVSSSGTPPLAYQWQFNSTNLVNGGRISGATNSILTITNVVVLDVGNYSVIVSNAAGSTNSTNYATTTLTVNSLPADYLYAETFPYVGPAAVESVSAVGWANAIPDYLNRLYEVSGGDGAIYAYESGGATTAFYTTSQLDTGFSGLPFPVINPASYPAIAFSVDINPSYNSAYVAAYFAVQMNGSDWFVSQSALPVNDGIAGFTTYQQPFDPSAIQWYTLTLGASGATIGGQPANDLIGNITGAGVVAVHSGAGTLGFDNFLVITDTVPPLPPTAPFVTQPPLSQTVYAGGGVSFTVTASGTMPFSYFWQTNGVALANGGRISGANSNMLTILNVNSNDEAQYSVIVSNVAGTDNSANYEITTLTVSDVPPGLLYAETFPYVGPAVGGSFPLYPLSTIGWASAIPDIPNRLYENDGGDGAASAYEPSSSTPITTAFYTTSSLDTGFSGLPFPSINTTLYGGITFSVDLAPSLNPTNLTEYFAVQMNGGSWFVSATAIPVPGVAMNSFTTYTQAYNPAASNWKTLTLNPNNATIGGVASSDLSGSITGAGLVTSFSGTGTYSCDNFLVTTTTGVSVPGGIIVGSVSNNGKYITFSWIGSANIHLQSTTNLAPPVIWQDVPNTTGQSTVTVTNTVPQKFYRLIWP
jgi:hypothetical protein